MSSCTHNCAQGRDCTCACYSMQYKPTPEQSAKHAADAQNASVWTDYTGQPQPAIIDDEPDVWEGADHELLNISAMIALIVGVFLWACMYAGVL
jgi:hypothetical protein